jgi:hypothetical protein
MPIQQAGLLPQQSIFCTLTVRAHVQLNDSMKLPHYKAILSGFQLKPVLNPYQKCPDSDPNLDLSNKNVQIPTRR